MLFLGGYFEKKQKFKYRGFKNHFDAFNYPRSLFTRDALEF